MSAGSTAGRKERMRWLLQIVGSVVVPAAIAALTTDCALNREIDEGRAVFDNIGFRYFGAVYNAYDLDTFQFKTDPEEQAAYRAVLSDIARDIRWLRTNPLYGRLQARDKYATFALVQNALTREANGAHQLGVDGTTLKLLCSIFEPGNHGGGFTQRQRRRSSGATRAEFGSDLVEFGARVCGQCGLSEN